MSSIFPLREKVTLDEEREPRLVEIDEDTADDVFEALSSQTTRTIFLELHNAPQTASDLADVTETSVQNVQYHLKKLLDADLVEVVDTWYSERGSEMKVYAPQDESLVLFAGRDKQRSLRSLLSRFVGVLGLLVPASAFAGWATSQSDGGVGGLLGGADDEGADGSESANGGAETADAAAEGGNGAAANGDEVSPRTQGTEEQTEDVQANGDEVEVTTSNGDGGSETPEIDGDVDLSDSVDFTAENASDYEIVTDGGQATPDGVVDGASNAIEGAAGLDPALAAAVAFFIGGLFVFAALTMWYGRPDTWG